MCIRDSPSAMSGKPCTEAIVENKDSGRVVPILTIVAPISTSGKCSLFARETALSTNKLLPHINSTNPSTNIKM